MTSKEMFTQIFGQFKNNNRLTLATYNQVLQALERKEELEKENQELKQMNKTLFIHNTEFSLGVPNILNENEKLKKAIEILKEVVNLDANRFIETERQFYRLTTEEYTILKEVLE